MEKAILGCGQIRGKEHIDIPMQDRTAVYQDDVIQVIALSDGCSSSGVLSGIGAEATVEFLRQLFVKQPELLFPKPNPGVIRSAIHQGILNILDTLVEKNKDAIEKLKKLPNNPYDKAYAKMGEPYASRSLFNASIVFVVKTEHFAIAGHLGDGFVLGIRNGQLGIISYEHKEVGQANVTHYAAGTKPNAEGKWPTFYHLYYLKEEDGYDGFILTSDGAELLVPPPARVERNNQVLWVYEPNLDLANEILKVVESGQNLSEWMEKANHPTEEDAYPLDLDSGDDCSFAILMKPGLQAHASIPTEEVRVADISAIRGTPAPTPTPVEPKKSEPVAKPQPAPEPVIEQSKPEEPKPAPRVIEPIKHEIYGHGGFRMRKNKHVYGSLLQIRRNLKNRSLYKSFLAMCEYIATHDGATLEEMRSEVPSFNRFFPTANKHLFCAIDTVDGVERVYSYIYLDQLPLGE